MITLISLELVNTTWRRVCRNHCNVLWGDILAARYQFAVQKIPEGKQTFRDAFMMIRAVTPSSWGYQQRIVYLFHLLPSFCTCISISFVTNCQYEKVKQKYRPRRPALDHRKAKAKYYERLASLREEYDPTLSAILPIIREAETDEVPRISCSLAYSGRFYSFWTNVNFFNSKKWNWKANLCSSTKLILPQPWRTRVDLPSNHWKKFNVLSQEYIERALRVFRELDGIQYSSILYYYLNRRLFQERWKGKRLYRKLSTWNSSFENKGFDYYSCFIFHFMNQ